MAHIKTPPHFSFCGRSLAHTAASGVFADNVVLVGTDADAAAAAVLVDTATVAVADAAADAVVADAAADAVVAVAAAVAAAVAVADAAADTVVADAAADAVVAVAAAVAAAVAVAVAAAVAVAVAAADAVLADVAAVVADAAVVPESVGKYNLEIPQHHQAHDDQRVSNAALDDRPEHADHGEYLGNGKHRARLYAQGFYAHYLCYREERLREGDELKYFPVRLNLF